MNTETLITNLLYSYAEYIDAGDLEGAARLFKHAKIKVLGNDQLFDHQQILEHWKEYIRIYPCGTPRTKHLMSNTIVEFDEEEGTAKTRCYYTVYQAVDDFPLQLVASGRYHDRFERVEGKWRFCYRDYSLLDFMGDLSRHLKVPVPV